LGVLGKYFGKISALNFPKGFPNIPFSAPLVYHLLIHFSEPNALYTPREILSTFRWGGSNEPERRGVDGATLGLRLYSLSTGQAGKAKKNHVYHVNPVKCLLFTLETVEPFQFLSRYIGMD